MRIQGASDGVMNGRSLGHNARHFPEQAKRDAAGDGIVAVDHLKDPTDELVDVDDLVQVALR